MNAKQKLADKLGCSIHQIETVKAYQRELNAMNAKHTPTIKDLTNIEYTSNLPIFYNDQRIGLERLATILECNGMPDEPTQEELSQFVSDKAAYIIHCVNMHDELVEALELMLGIVLGMDNTDYIERINIAKKALAKESEA